jgi:hypothetical protein
MTMYYSASANGFFDSEIHGNNIPKDSVEITQDQWKELLKGQSEGKKIEANRNGKPVLVDLTLTQDQIVASLSAQVQNALDKGAQAWGYANIATGVSYLGSTSAQFAADAQALNGWRDSVWNWAFDQFKTVTPTTNPSVFVASIPAQPEQPKV